LQGSFLPQTINANLIIIEFDRKSHILTPRGTALLANKGSLASTNSSGLLADQKIMGYSRIVLQGWEPFQDRRTRLAAPSGYDVQKTMLNSNILWIDVSFYAPCCGIAFGLGSVNDTAEGLALRLTWDGQATGLERS
jgi:hypothetical protein